MTQSQRLLHISRGAKEARLAYARGEITHEERMKKLNALVTGPSLTERARGLMRKYKATAIDILMWCKKFKKDKL